MTQYIKFQVNDKNQFTDFQIIFNHIAKAKNDQIIQTNRLWFNQFPDYALSKFSFSSTDLQPTFKTTSASNAWHFYTLIEHLQINLEIEYLECKIITDNIGQLTFIPNAYPFGGISGLIAWLNAFNCKPFEVDEGTGIYTIDWKNDYDFRLKPTFLTKVKQFMNRL